MGAEVPGVDPAAVKMRRRVGGQMPATHTHGATAEMGSTATHTHAATAKVSSATATTEVRAAATTAEMSATAATAEVSAATTSAANMSTTAPAPAASRVSSRRQTKGYGYCGRACRDFPHDTPHQGQMRQANARSARSVPA